MPLSRDDRNFVEWLKETLIPDLEEGGMPETAKDFERCIQIIEDLDTETREKCKTKASRTRR